MFLLCSCTLSPAIHSLIKSPEEWKPKNLESITVSNFSLLFALPTVLSTLDTQYKISTGYIYIYKREKLDTVILSTSI